MKKKLSIKGIIVGGLVVIGGLILQGMVVILFLFIDSVRLGTSLSPSDRLSKILGDISNHQPLVGILLFVFTALVYILGGYIAARVAKHDELLNGASAAFVIFLTAFFTTRSISSILPNLLGLIIAVAFATVGGYLRLRQGHKS